MTCPRESYKERTIRYSTGAAGTPIRGFDSRCRYQETLVFTGVFGWQRSGMARLWHGLDSILTLSLLKGDRAERLRESATHRVSEQRIDARCCIFLLLLVDSWPSARDTV